MAKRKMTLMVITPRAETIHQALLTAASASAMGQHVYLFFAKDAAKALVQDGWKQVLTSLGETSEIMDKRLEDKGIADYEILMNGINSMNVDLYICEQAIKEHAIDPLNLITRPQPDVISLSELIAKGSGGDWLTF